MYTKGPWRLDKQLLYLTAKTASQYTSTPDNGKQEGPVILELLHFERLN